MKNLIRVFVLVCLAIVPSLLRAHGGMEHVMGTITSIEGSAISVQTTKKQKVVIATDDTTTYEQGGKAASMKTLSVGERVVVHAKKGEKGLLAEIVKWGMPAGAQGKHGHDEKSHDHDHAKK